MTLAQVGSSSAVLKISPAKHPRYIVLIAGWLVTDELE
jgi:hypothetical protein